MRYKIPLPNSRNHLPALPLLVLESLFRTIPLRCRGFGGFYGHCTRTNVQSGIFPPTSKQVVVWERECTWVDFGRSGGNCIWVYLGCSWIVRSHSNCQGFLPKQKHSCSSSLQQVQLPCARSKSVLDHNAAAPPPHGELDLLLIVSVHPQFHLTHQ